MMLDEKKIKEEYVEYQNKETKQVKAAQQHLSDTGNGKRFAIYSGADFRYCWDVDEWLYWDGKCWNPKLGKERVKVIAKGVALHILEEAKINAPSDRGLDKGTALHALKTESERGLNAMVSLARSEPPIAAYKEDFDKDSYLLNCRTGIIDLRTGNLLPHHQDYFITKMANVDFDENAKCPLWLKCLATWMGGDQAKIDYLQQTLGMCLTGDISARAFPIFYGSGKNGKSSCLDAVTEIMGDYASIGMESLLEQKTLPQHPCDIADLIGKRLVTIDETKEGMRLRTALVKRMTGDRKLKGRFMRQNPFEFNTTHHTIMMSQHLPVITETADAIWDRVCLLKWDVRIADDEIDPHLADKLKEEYPGILNWLICGCFQWQQAGYILKSPETVESATHQYRKDSDPLGEFIDEDCDVAPNFFVAVKDLFLAYSNWCKENDVKYSYGKRHFNEKLRTRGCISKPKRYKNAAGTERFDKCWFGITLQENPQYVTESVEKQEPIPF